MCSPSHFSTFKTTGTCLRIPEIVEIAKVVLDPSTISRLLQNSPTQTSSLLDAVHRVMGTKPGEELRWLGTPVVRHRPQLEARLKEAFRPAYPESWIANPVTWLTNFDIARVMEQYEQTYPHFEFVGVFPRDFAARSSWTGRCISPPMCDLTVAALQARGKTDFGCVFNMDKAGQRGSHWMALYGCIAPQKRYRFGVWYYDSMGAAPPVEIQAFMERFRNEMATIVLLGGKKNRDAPVGVNGVRRQMGRTECGVYAIFFIVVCLTTKYTFDKICRTVMKKDGTMKRMRNVFFRPPVTSN